MINRLKTIWAGYSDKIIHFLFGYFIASQFQATGYWMVLPAVIAGTAKEIYDFKQSEEQFKLSKILNADWACTVTGGFIALWVYAISLYIGGVHLPGFIDVIINK